MIRRFLVGLLVFAMVFGIFPTSAFADTAINSKMIQVIQYLNLDSGSNKNSIYLRRDVKFSSEKEILPNFDTHYIRLEGMFEEQMNFYVESQLGNTMNIDGKMRLILYIPKGLAGPNEPTEYNSFEVSRNNGFDVDYSVEQNHYVIDVKSISEEVTNAIKLLSDNERKNIYFYLTYGLEFDTQHLSKEGGLFLFDVVGDTINTSLKPIRILEKNTDVEMPIWVYSKFITGDENGYYFSQPIAYRMLDSAVASATSLVDNTDVYDVEYNLGIASYFLELNNEFPGRMYIYYDRDGVYSAEKDLVITLPFSEDFEIFDLQLITNTLEDFNLNEPGVLYADIPYTDIAVTMVDNKDVSNEKFAVSYYRVIDASAGVTPDKILYIVLPYRIGRNRAVVDTLTVKFKAKIKESAPDDRELDINDRPSIGFSGWDVEPVSMLPIGNGSSMLGKHLSRMNGQFYFTSAKVRKALGSPELKAAYNIHHIEVTDGIETVLRTETNMGAVGTTTSVTNINPIISEIKALGYTMTGIENTEILPDGSAIVKVKYAKNKLTLKAVSGSKEENGHTQVLAGYTSIPSGITVTNLDSSSILARGEGINPGTYTVDFGTKEPKTKDDSGKVYFTEYEPGVLTITKKPSSSTPYVPPVDPTPSDDTPTKKEDPKPEIVPTPDTEDVPKGPVIPKLNKKDHFAYIFGYPDGTVRSAANLTREEAAAIFYRLLDPEYRKAIEKDAVNIFPDVRDDKWSVHEIATLTKGGILHGYPDNSFRPDNPITRAEIAKIASMFDNLEPLDVDAFVDIDNHWARTFINSAAKKGWIHGYDNAIFQPDKFITREEFVSLVNNMLDRRVEEKGLLEDRIKFPDLMDNTLWGYYPMTSASNGYEYENYERDGFIFQKWTKMKNDHLIKK